MKKIFISYKRVDRDKVFAIKDRIEAATGLECWIDLEGIESDAQFMHVIINAIRNCEVLLFMYSKEHLKIQDFEADWTMRELSFAAKKKKRIVFINIDGSELSDIFEFTFSTKQQVNAQSDEAIARLCRDICKWLKLPVPENTPPSPAGKEAKADQTTPAPRESKPLPNKELEPDIFAHGLAIKVDWGQGYAIDFLNGITVYDPVNGGIIGRKEYFAVAYSTELIRSEARVLLDQYLMEHNFSVTEVIVSMLNRAIEKALSEGKTKSQGNWRDKR